MKKPRIPWRRFFAEFLVIFVGVSLSLLADDWRSTRMEAREEREAKALLLEDLTDDARQLQRVAQDLPAQDSAAAWLSAHWANPSLSGDSVELRLTALLPLERYRPLRAAFLSLQAGSGIGLIGESGLRRDLVRYFEATQTDVAERTLTLWTHRENLWKDLWGYVVMPPGATSASMLPSADEPPSLAVPLGDILRDRMVLNRIGQVGVSANLAYQAINEALERNADLTRRLTASRER